MNKYMNMPLYVTEWWPHSSFIPIRTFTRQLRKTNGLHMKLQYWDFFFFCFKYCGLKQNTFLVSNVQLIHYWGLKATTCKKLKGLTLFPFGSVIRENQAIGFWKAEVHQLCTPAFNCADTGSLCSSLSSLYPLAWGCSLLPIHRTRGAQRQLTQATSECFNIFKITFSSV